MASKIVLNNIDFVMKDKRAVAGVLDLNKTKWKASPHSRISEPYDCKKLSLKKGRSFAAFCCWDDFHNSCIHYPKRNISLILWLLKVNYRRKLLVIIISPR